MTAFSRLDSTQLVAGLGEVVESEDTIILESVPIITPNRDIVVSSLSFEVRTMLLTCQPNSVKLIIYDQIKTSFTFFADVITCIENSKNGKTTHLYLRSQHELVNCKALFGYQCDHIWAYIVSYYITTTSHIRSQGV